MTCPRGVKPWGPASRFHLFALSQLGFRLLSGARTAERRKTPLIEFTEVKMSDVTVTPLKKNDTVSLFQRLSAERRPERRRRLGKRRTQSLAFYSQQASQDVINNVLLLLNLSLCGEA